MARTIRNQKIDSRSARSQLKCRREPYWTVMGTGCAIGYRRIATGGSWIAKYRDDTGHRTYEALGTADDARDADGLTVFSFAQAQTQARSYFDRRVREIAGDVIPMSGPFTVTNAVDFYIAAYERRGGKNLDLMVGKAKNYVYPTIGPVPVTKLTKGRIERWLYDIAESPARLRTRPGAPQKYRQPLKGPDARRRRRATANRVFGLLRAALNHAYQEGRIAHDDAWRRVRALRDANSVRICYLSDDESRRLVSACEPDFRQLVVAALLTGCRYSEITNLLAEDYNRDGGTIRIQFSKSGKPRYVVLSDEGRSFFERQVLGKHRDDPMFVRTKGQRWKNADQSRPMKAACSKVVLENVTFHGFRHTYASRLAMKGVPFAVIAAQLGHADTRMVEKHYGHLAPSYIADTVRAAFTSIGIVNNDNVVRFGTSA